MIIRAVSRWTQAISLTAFIVLAALHFGSRGALIRSGVWGKVIFAIVAVWFAALVVTTSIDIRTVTRGRLRPHPKSVRSSEDGGRINKRAIEMASGAAISFAASLAMTFIRVHGHLVIAVALATVGVALLATAGVKRGNRVG